VLVIEEGNDVLNVGDSTDDIGRRRRMLDYRSYSKE
jgi:hypothetical protein